MSKARYDGHAEWYDEFATSELGRGDRKTVIGLLGPGPGALVDVGCGGGSHAVAFTELGWSVTGIDNSEDQLRLARARGVDVRTGSAEALPLEDASFDAAVSMWTHTDVDDFSAQAGEIARVLRPGAPFVYLGAHPCFVGPHSRFVAGEGLPELERDYRITGRYDKAHDPDGIRARVGATHLPLALFLQTFVDAGFRLDRIEEPGDREYPYTLALRWRR
ncbi:MAG: class I SAM-dependent methyltransferase [Actinobacteria bacterium]|nr:class I SAM-dependent methyltransferase [Actinomycetota bacterium]